MKQVTQGYFAAKQQQEYLFALYQKLDTVLLANKSYIQALGTLRSIALAADTPNLTLIASLDEAGAALILIQEQGADMMKLLARN